MATRSVDRPISNRKRRALRSEELRRYRRSAPPSASLETTTSLLNVRLSIRLRRGVFENGFDAGEELGETSALETIPFAPSVLASDLPRTSSSMA